MRFWAEVLHYEEEGPPAGHASWREFWLSIGLPEQEAVDSGGSIVDPEGVGPRMFFQDVPEGKTVKNRVHLDIDVTEGRKVPIEVRKEQVDAEAARLVAVGATVFRVLSEEGLDHYAVVMQDPEGNEFCLR